MPKRRTCWIPIAVLLAAGCGGGDGGPTRSFQLALTGTQLRIDPPVGLQLTAADLAADADVVSLHQDFYGLPWEAFEAGTQPPAEWLAAMDRLPPPAGAGPGGGSPGRLVHPGRLAVSETRRSRRQDQEEASTRKRPGKKQGILRGWRGGAVRVASGGRSVSVWPSLATRPGPWSRTP
jgi:hypothetical protein